MEKNTSSSLKLLTIQSRLNAPKNQRSEFGGYYYRSAEDILQAVKPLLAETKTVVTLSDTVMANGDHIFVFSTAALSDAETGEEVEKATGCAAIDFDKKSKMDKSQLTGAASSYARKYALNGLFAIDDNKDADSMPATIDTLATILGERKVDIVDFCQRLFKVMPDKLPKEKLIYTLQNLESGLVAYEQLRGK